jgi:tight adherence protein C
VNYFQVVIVALVWLVGAAIGIWLARHWSRSLESRRRLYQSSQDAPLALVAPPRELGPLARWLYLAGFRQESAAPAFVIGTAVCVAAGATATYLIYATGITALLVTYVAVIPGGVGDVFLPAAHLAPWLVLVLFSALPLLVVRRARQRRVQLVEQDLPLALELLATLAEAGLAFDGALARILETQLGGRPLAGELRTYQADLLAGRGRVESLRRLSRRLEIPAVSILVSALVQAEQIGMGVAAVLRRQAEDLRDRRRQRLAAFASGLAVKRMVPLVACFLPGLFVWSLGPLFVQLFKIADTFIQVRTL